jgi:DNA topoisomerase VI subunit B
MLDTNLQKHDSWRYYLNLSTVSAATRMSLVYDDVILREAFVVWGSRLAMENVSSILRTRKYIFLIFEVCCCDCITGIRSSDLFSAQRYSNVGTLLTSLCPFGQETTLGLLITIQ